MRPAELAALRDKRVVVMPDVYIDVLVPLPAWAEARKGLDGIAAHGGGNLPVPGMTFKLGGNAANLAVALSRLGAQVELIAATDEFGHTLLSRAAKGTALSLDRVRRTAQPASTVALECTDGNLMLSHAGPVADFGPEHLDQADREILQSADAVAVVNWAQNRRGTSLLQEVAATLVDTPAFLYLDTADPRHRGDDAAALMAASDVWRRVDAWGVNENELGAFSAFRRGPGPAGTDPLGAATALAQHLGVRIDVHTRHWAASVAPTPDATPPRVAAEAPPGRRKTGAGDVWNAGNLAGYLLSWSDHDRLRFAHRVASAYVTDENGLPPRAADLDASTPAAP